MNLVMSDYAKIMKCLSTDIPLHISHLKMLKTYQDSITYKIIEGRSGWAVSMLIPISISSFDLAAYPKAKYIVYIAGSAEKLIDDVISELPEDVDLVFKISESRDINLVNKRFDVRYIKSFITYSCEESINAKCDKVIISQNIDNRLLPLWYKNGYSMQSIKNYFQNGAKSFALYEDENPISTCIIFPCYNNIWEIGAVHTIQKARCKGYAKIVVSTAVNDVIKAGYKPIYQVVQTNIPSSRLADSIGLKVIMKLDHFYYSSI